MRTKENKIINFVKTWVFQITTTTIVLFFDSIEFTDIPEVLVFSTLVFSISCLPVILVKLKK